MYISAYLIYYLSIYPILHFLITSIALIVAFVWFVALINHVFSNNLERFVLGWVQISKKSCLALFGSSASYIAAGAPVKYEWQKISWQISGIEYWINYQDNFVHRYVVGWLQKSPRYYKYWNKYQEKHLLHISGELSWSEDSTAHYRYWSKYHDKYCDKYQVC